MRMYDVIQKKRDGFELTDEEIRFFINGYVDGSIPDYQASALTMAIFFNGMTDREIGTLTEAIANSGDTVDLSLFGDLSCDKHSTGGVGDKTSLIVSPTVASLGGFFAKMSGRGLGHTGGTVDKLESIPGYRIQLSPDEFLSTVTKTGVAVIGQSGNLTPADKKLYALRDVTATVDSIPLITSSIMGKKLAAGAKNIVLDVKVGSGAFMKTLDGAKELAEKMVTIGKMHGRRIAALLTDMDEPLGTNVGNSLEIIEAVRVLRNEVKNDLLEVSVALSSELIRMLYGISENEAEQRVREAIESGRAYETFRKWIAAQGGDIRAIDDFSLLPGASVTCEVLSPSDGCIASMNASEIGISAMILGAGRASKEDSIDYGAGIVLKKKTGDRVKQGEPVAVLYTNDEAKLPEAEKRFLGALTFSEKAPVLKPLIYEIIR